jgi:hypothetical protein
MAIGSEITQCEVVAILCIPPHEVERQPAVCGRYRCGSRSLFRIKGKAQMV